MKSAMTWQEFRERYSRLHTCNLRSRADAESRLNVIGRILKPKYLRDVANTETLERLRTLLLEGVEARPLASTEEGQLRTRSPHTVKTFMAVLIAALRWAEYTGVLEEAPRLRRVKVSKIKHMKGRPLTEEELKSMLNAAEAIVPRRNLEHWRYLLRGLWCSGLRLNELLNVHWDDAQFITPRWQEWSLPVLSIPATMQKNDTEESIPLLPDFEALLLEVPAAKRTGWVFNPFGGRRGIAVNGKRRMKRDRVSRIISKIGQHAGVVVSESRGGRPAKYASAHDLRRSCADRLIAAGVPERDVARIMRHASIETTRRYYAPVDVQRSARVIRDCHADPAKRVVDRLDRKWLVQAIKDIEGDKRVVGSSSWVVRVDAVKHRFKELVGDEGAFPWSDSVIIDLWGTLS